MNIKAIAFDFDGVIVTDSDAVFKKEAWGKAFAKYGDAYKEPLRVGNTMFGSGRKGGREEIMAHMFATLGEPPEAIPELVTEASRVFNDHVQGEIKNAGLAEGVREALERLHSLGIALYFNSGTATAPLNESTRLLGLEKVIKKALGSTPNPVGGSKVHNLEHIARSEQVERGEILVVGDGESDQKAAEEFGCAFVGLSNRWNNWGSDQSFPTVNSLKEIELFLK